MVGLRKRVYLMEFAKRSEASIPLGKTKSDHPIEYSLHEFLSKIFVNIFSKNIILKVKILSFRHNVASPFDF